MKKLFGVGLPFFVIHFFCCGVLLFFLISSGLLLAFREEGRNKIFLIPIILAGTGLIWFYRYQANCCRRKGHKTIFDHILNVVIYLSISLIFGLAFIVYLFIPWWIPNYKGGILLP